MDTKKKAEERRRKDRQKEIIAYSIVGLFWLGGLSMCILGVVAYNSPVSMDDNPIYQAEKNWATAWNLSRPVDFRIVGTLVCLIAMCFFLGFVNHFANRYEKDVVRRSRQEQRLAELLAADKKQSEEEVKAIEDERKKREAEFAAQQKAMANGPALPPSNPPSSDQQ